MIRCLLVDSHYGRAANAIWRPQTFGPDSAWVGWDVIVGGDEENSTFVYMVPDLNSSPPHVDVYVGRTGDPEQDALVSVIGVTPMGWGLTGDDR